MITLCASFLLKIVPLYLNVLLGFIAGKFTEISRDSIARLLIYIFAPIVFFNGVANIPLDLNILFLPFMILAISVLLCGVFYRLSGLIWQDSTKNLVAFSAGTGNSGYFGLPLALLLLDDKGEGIYIMAVLGMVLYENTVGFYIIARGKHSVSDCLLKLVKLPALYAIAFGLLINLLNISLPEIIVEFIDHIKAAFSVLGLVIIGLGMAALKKIKTDFSFIGMTFLAKFIAWPALIGMIIAGDRYFGIFDSGTYQALTLFSFVPLAANLVIFSAVFDIHTEKAASAVFFSIIVSIIYIPFMVGCFIL